ncbi:MAG: 30S ribosomal protein S20, partial [Acidobacteriota bacterium]
AVRAATKRIDSAASKGIIHKNAAARKKSRMMKKVNAAG